MKEYDELVNSLIKRLDGNDENVIFATIALFTLEWKYQIELFYNCVVEAEKLNVKEVPKDRIAALCAELSMPVPPHFTQILHTESRFVLHRLELVCNVYEDTDKLWEEIKDKLWQYFIAKYYIKREIVHKWSMPEYFVTHILRDKWADFFREHYDLRKIYKSKEWTNKRIRYVRKLYDARKNCSEEHTLEPRTERPHRLSVQDLCGSGDTSDRQKTGDPLYPKA